MHLRPAVFFTALFCIGLFGAAPAFSQSRTLEDVLLVDLNGSADPDIQALQAALAAAAGDEAAYENVLEAAGPIIHGAEAEGVRNVGRRTFGLINQRLAMLRAEGTGESELETWWQFYGQNDDHDARNGVKGYQMTTYGLAVGADKALFDGVVFGASFAWGDVDASSKGAGRADTNGDSYMLSFYNDIDTGRLYVNTMLSYAYNEFNNAKTSAAGRRTGQYHANYYGARAEIGYALRQEKLRLIPKMIGHYSYFIPDSYIENGPAAQVISQDSTKSLELGVGLDIQGILRHGENAYWVPELRLGYRFNRADEPVMITARFLAGGPDFEAEGFDPADHALDLGLGVSYFSNQNYELLFNYDFSFKSDYIGHAGTIRAAYKFY